MSVLLSSGFERKGIFLCCGDSLQVGMYEFIW